MLDNTRKWLTMWLMRVALKVHTDTFLNLCKLTTLQMAMKEQGVERFMVEEDEDGNTRIVPVHHNVTRH